MPGATIFSTTPIQQKLMHGIQDIIVQNFEALWVSKSIFQNLRLLIELMQVALRIRKLPMPTHNNVNKHNSHVMIDLRDWFLAHEDPKGSRYKVFVAILNLPIIKYEFDDFMSRRLDKWLEEWLKMYLSGEGWVFSGKHPDSQWILNEEDKQDPRVIRYESLKEALHNGEWGKVMNLVD